MIDENTKKLEAKLKIGEIIKYAELEGINIVIGVEHKDGSYQMMTSGNIHALSQISCMLKWYNKKASKDKTIKHFLKQKEPEND